MGVFYGLLSMASWGIADFLAAKSSRKIGFALTLLWSQIFGFFIISIYFLTNFQLFNLSDVPKFLLILAIAGILNMIAGLAYFKGLKEGKVSLVSPIGASFALIIVILSILFFKETLTANQIIGIILIILGLPLLSINIKKISGVKKIDTLVGAKEGLVAMLGWGFSLFLIIPAIKVLNWFLPIFIFRFFTLLFLLSYVFFGKQSFKISFPITSLALPLLIGLLDVIAFFGYSFGIKGEYASIVAPIVASFPLITVILARVFFKEKIVLNQALGIISVITGLILIST
jgi:drug/metabolite transporter (DMT)-like permease